MMRKRTQGTRGWVAAAGLGTILCALAVGAAAQEEPVAEPPAPQEQPARYTVEIIVFAYDDPSSAGNEVFTPPEPLFEEPFAEALPGTGAAEGPVFDDRTPSRAEADTEALSAPLGEIPARARIELRRLEPEAFRMQDAWRKLRQLDVYRPILHAAWTQTTHDKSLSPTLPLRSLSDPPLGLDGSISLYQSRFLHLDVDITLDASGFAAGNARRTATDRLVRRNAADAAEPGAIAEQAPDGMASLPVRYRISEDRIMRDGEVRYFDHPRFGMLATVSRVEGGASSGPSADAQ